jgi:hypothetical protein
MKINELIQTIEILVLKCIKDRNPYQERKILYFSDNLMYSLEITSGINNVPYDARAIDDSHDKYIIHQIEKFISDTVSKNLNNNILETIIYNVDDTLSFPITIILYKLIKELEFIYPDDKYEEEIIKRKDLSYNQKWKDKLVTLLMDYQKWMNLTDIVHLTRGLRDPFLRKKLLEELVDEEIILKKHDILGKRRIKTLYQYKNTK